jgi:hypothetical protein
MMIFHVSAEWNGLETLKLRDRLKGPICINSFKPSGFFIHRLVYHSEIRLYAGKMQCLIVLPVSLRGFLPRVTPGAENIDGIIYVFIA